MASLAARTDLVDQVEDAVAKGATVHLGGEVPDGPGAFYPATVLTGVTPEMRAFHEELFGPVAVLYQVDSVDDAITLANDSPYGLGSAVFTGDVDQADESPTASTSAWSGSTPPSRAHPTCRSVE